MKRCIAALLTAVLLLAHFPIAVSAQEESAATQAVSPSIDTSFEESNGVGVLIAEDLSEAQAAQDATTIADYGITGLTIDGNGGG